MTSLFLLPSATVLFSPLLALQTIPLVAIIGGLVIGGTIALSAIYFHHKRNQMWHETARLALEKGQPVPPMPLRDEELALRPPPGVSFAEWQQAKLVESRTHAFRGGLILVAIGIGLHLVLGPGNMIGAIPGLIGVALIINALIERFALCRRDATENRPPQT